ncbi:MAG: hypothetical protein EAZ34_03145 [Polaromonas sp.]|nr:MAG: hypothetical protein EAZ34_03145 [Polaromonas sp.]
MGEVLRQRYATCPPPTQKSSLKFRLLFFRLPRCFLPLVCRLPVAWPSLMPIAKFPQPSA